MPRGRGSLGFRRINGTAIKLEITKKIGDRAYTKDAAKSLQQYVVSSMNKAGRAARDRAKHKSWSPYLTGALISTIKWEKAKLTQNRNIVSGSLVAGGPSKRIKNKKPVIVHYAEYQEFHGRPEKKLYLTRALKLVARPMLKKLLADKGIYQEIIVGGKKFRRS